ncbi:MAG: sigma-54 dependent transcriptional regulator [Desulforhopalus sp.]
MKLLIIDDEENMCHMLKAMIERHGYQIKTAYNGQTALELIDREHFDFILCDVKMPQVDGIMFLEKGADKLKDSTVIMMSAYGTVDLAIAAMKAGAYDFISKPFKSDEVLLTLKKAEEREQLKKENRQLKNQLDELSGGTRFGSMVAASGQMTDLFAMAERVSQYDTTVLITGESGTGKELVAKGIHGRSPRSSKSFVAVNCGSIPENLLESELFGYVKGAFTGAERNKKGLFEEANGATLFLDEIAELPLAMQVKLLRVLQENEIRPIGSGRTIPIDVRVLAATARNLEEAVADGSFREDLYYRLNVMPIRVPPLRERREDIPLLCHHFVKKFNSQFDMRVKGISPEAMSLIIGYPWPGNVRELENAIQRGMVLTQSEFVEIGHLPVRIQDPHSEQKTEISLSNSEGGLSLKFAQKQLEAKLIALALSKCGGNKSRAAEMLELSYPSLLSKIKLYSL